MSDTVSPRTTHHKSQITNTHYMTFTLHMQVYIVHETHVRFKHFNDAHAYVWCKLWSFARVTCTCTSHHNKKNMNPWSMESMQFWHERRSIAARLTSRCVTNYKCRVDSVLDNFKRLHKMLIPPPTKQLIAYMYWVLLCQQVCHTCTFGFWCSGSRVWVM